MNFIFDLYGTLIDIWTDESSEEFWRGICSLLNLSGDKWEKIKTEYSTLCAKKKRGKYHEIDLIEVFKDIISAHKSDIAPEMMAKSFRDLSIKRLQLFPRVREMLEKLRCIGAGVYLVSNAQGCFTRDELSKVGITELFNGIILSSEEGVKKPSKKIFKSAFSRFNISKKGSYYIGNDMFDDILGAGGVGLGTVYIKTEQSGKYDTKKLPIPDYVATDHEDLERILISIAQGNKI